MLSKKFIVMAVLFLCFVVLSHVVYGAKSVFIISNHYSNLAEAFGIDSGQISFQAMVDITTSNPGYGPVGIAVWPEKELMFITYESSSKIVWSSTKTLEKVGEFNTSASNISGIAVDSGKQKIYVIPRGGNSLYVYRWDDSGKTLILDGTHTLQYSTGLIGTALDELNGRVYVSNSTKTIRYYDTTNWAYQGSIDIVVGSNDRPAVGITVDPVRGYLYTGNWQSHNSLVKTSTTSPYTSTEVQITRQSSASRLIGVDVDKETGYIYCTTYFNDFRVYDSNLVLQDTETNNYISGPAGVAVGGWYKVSQFSLVKDNNDLNNECVYPWNMIEENYLTFDIYWDANGCPDTNVMIIDYLPEWCDYYSSVPAGDYNSVEHSVTWFLGDIAASDNDRITIQTKVNEWARPGSFVTNQVVMEGDLYRNTAACNVNVCNWGSEIIYVDKDAAGYNNGTDWDNAYADLRDAFIGAKNLGADVTAIWVAAGIYKPTYNINETNYQNKSFELLQNLALIGHFGGIGTYESSLDQRNLADVNNATILEGRIGSSSLQAVYNVVKAMNITNALLDGFTIKDSYSGSGAGIYLDNADVSIVNCRLENNYYYGISANNYSYPNIHNCTFFNNSSAGCYSYNHSQPVVSYSTFDGNNVYGTQGLAMYSNCAVTVDNCLFKNNKNYGIYGTSNGNLVVTGSQFTNNQYGLNLSDITTSVVDSNIESSTYYGFYCSNSNITLDHSLIKTSTNSGVNANNSDLNISHCLLAGNGGRGIYTSNGCNLTVNNSIIRRNGYHGLDLNDETTTTIKNSWINKNGLKHIADPNGSGIYLAYTTQTPLIRNVTIYDNWKYGIHNVYGPDPNVRNCIIYENDVNDFFRNTGGDPFNKVNYCCLQHPHSGQGNFVANPMFTLNDPNDLHIDDDSPCVDAGDPCGVYADEKDIDDEPRNDGRLDIGADENFWSKADYNEDGIVDLLDYCTFANAWLKTNTQVSLDNDSDVDYVDLALFHRDWLWQRGASLGWLQTMIQGGCGSQNMEMMEMTVADDESILTDVPVEADNTPMLANVPANSLMITDVQKSRALMPPRLARKTAAFYAITAEKVSEPVDIEGLLNWLDGIWNNGDLRDVMTESEYLELKEAIQTSAE